MGIVVSAATLGFAIWLLVDFQSGEAGYQLLEEHSWMSSLGVGYVLGVDGISLFMVALNALLFPLAFIASVREHDQKSFAVWMLLLEGALMGVFLALDF